MKAIPFLFAGTAGLHPHAAADLVLTLGNEPVTVALGDIQTSGELPPSLQEAFSEFQASPHQDEEARLRLATAIGDTPPHQWRRVTLRHERHALQLEYLRQVTQGFSSFNPPPSSLSPQDGMTIRNLESGLNAFTGSEFLHNDVGQTDLFCQRVAQTLQNAALQVIAESAGVVWPSLNTFLESAQSEGYVPFSYHALSASPLDDDKEGKIQFIADLMRNRGITWPYRFVEWVRSLYLMAGDFKNGHRKTALGTLSKSMTTLLKTQSLTEGDLRKELGGAALMIGFPLPDFPENWPNDLQTRLAKWLIQVWDAARESPDWKELEACTHAWTSCWRESEDKEDKDTIRYELERWLNNTANSVTWRRTGDVTARIEELEKILVQISQDALETFRATRTPSPLRAPWRSARRFAAPIASPPEGFHFAGRIKADDAVPESEVLEGTATDGSQETPSVFFDESVFSGILTLTPETLSRPAALTPALDAAWLRSVMSADVEQIPTAPISEADTPIIAEEPPLEVESASLPDEDASLDATVVAEPIPMVANDPESGPTVSQPWTAEMRKFIKNENILKTKSHRGDYETLAIPRGRQDFITSAYKNWRGPKQMEIAENVRRVAAGTPHYNRVCELIEPLSNPTSQAPSQNTVDKFLHAIALLVHPDLFGDILPTETSLESWAKAISPFMTEENESLPGWFLIRKAMVEALTASGDLRPGDNRLFSVPGPRAVELLLQIAQDRPLALDDGWQSLMKLQFDSATGKEPSPDDAQKVADLMGEIATAMQRVDTAAMDDGWRLKMVFEEAGSGQRLCRDVLGSLIDGEDPRFEALIETEDLFRQIAERAEFALLEAGERTETKSWEIGDTGDHTPSGTTNTTPTSTGGISAPQEDQLFNAEREALAMLAIIRGFQTPASMTPAEYASVSAKCLPAIDRFLELHAAFKDEGGEKSEMFPLLQDTARTLRAEGLKWLTWEDEVPLATPVERPGPPSFLASLAPDRDFQIISAKKIRTLRALSAIPEPDYWRVNTVLELALIARDDLVYDRLCGLQLLLFQNGNKGHAVLFQHPQMGGVFRFYPRSSWKGTQPPWIDDIPPDGNHWVTDLSGYTLKMLQEYIEQPQHYYRNKVEYLYNFMSQEKRRGLSLENLLREKPNNPRSKSWQLLRSLLCQADGFGLSYFIPALENHPQLGEIMSLLGFQSTVQLYKSGMTRELALQFLKYPSTAEAVAERMGAVKFLKPMMETVTIRETYQNFDLTTSGLRNYYETCSHLMPDIEPGPDAQTMRDDWRNALQTSLLVSTPAGTHFVLRQEDKRRVEDYFDGRRKKNVTFDDPLTGNQIALRKYGAGFRTANAWEDASGWHRELLRRLSLLTDANFHYLEVAMNMVLLTPPNLAKLLPDFIRSIMKDTGDREATVEDVMVQMAVFFDIHSNDMFH